MGLRSTCRSRAGARGTVGAKLSALRFRRQAKDLTATQAQALLAELEPDRAARVAFILATGARWSESDTARRADIHLEGDVLRLRGTKTDGADRRVPVVAFSVPLLEHALTYGEGEDGLLFRPWGNVRRDLAAACARAGIPSLHAERSAAHLRHVVAPARQARHL